jgi:hypothetical protein
MASPPEGASFTRPAARLPEPGAEHPAAGRVVADPGDLMRTCPVCGKQLAERKCKLFCPDPV